MEHEEITYAGLLEDLETLSRAGLITGQVQFFLAQVPLGSEGWDLEPRLTALGDFAATFGVADERLNRTEAYRPADLHRPAQNRPDALGKACEIAGNDMVKP